MGDDGNMCILTCGVPNSSGREVSRATPIWCKDSGFFNARWTLSSHRESQQGDLCPKPNTTARSSQAGSLMALVQEDKKTQSATEAELITLRDQVASDDSRIAELTQQIA